MGLPSKTMGKKHNVFLMKLKQIRVKLYGNKSTFLANWKWSKLIDEKKNWEQ